MMKVGMQCECIDFIATNSVIICDLMYDNKVDLTDVTD